MRVSRKRKKREKRKSAPEISIPGPFISKLGKCDIEGVCSRERRAPLASPSLLSVWELKEDGKGDRRKGRSVALITKNEPGILGILYIGGKRRDD